MKKFYTDRSRTIQYQRCPRSRFNEYEFQHGVSGAAPGLVPVRKSLALIVGGCVHEGLAQLLLGNGEDVAVAVALSTFDDFLRDGKLELDAREQAELLQAVTVSAASIESVVDFSAELGLDPGDPLAARLTESRPNPAQEQEKYLEGEQRALVEGMVRSYSRRRLQPLLEEFEVLEVEREGEWLLSHRDDDVEAGVFEGFDLFWMSRPDALLRHRVTNDLHVMSFKTTGAWDHRKEKDAQRDMQGLSEGVEIERRLGEWWPKVKTAAARAETPYTMAARLGTNQATLLYLNGLDSPPRISAIRYEYLLKGERWKDKDLSAKLGIDCRTQNTPLLQPYKFMGISAGDDRYGWKYEYTDADGKSRRLDYRSWKKTPVWETMPMRAWIDMLDKGEVQPEAGDPLAAQFVAPMTVYRNEDDLMDWIEQTEAQEVRIVKASARVNSAEDEGERRHLLNVLFPMFRQSCEYPSSCKFVPLCYGSAEIRKDPISSGKYRARNANHPQEMNK